MIKRGFEIVRDEMRKHKDAVIDLPMRATKHAVACDLGSPIGVIIPAGGRTLIWTDVKSFFGEDEALLMNVRSSMGMKGIMMANSQGWIESDYHNNVKNDGNLGIALFNFGEEDFVIEAGDKVAQLMFIKKLEAAGTETDTLRAGGYGHTGK